MQSVSSRIWTCVAVSISYDYNNYTISSLLYIFSSFFLSCLFYIFSLSSSIYSFLSLIWFGAGGWVYRIHQLHLCRGVRIPNECPGYNTKQSNGEASVKLKLWEMYSTSLLPFLPNSLWPGVVTLDKILYLSQIELNCVLMLNWFCLKFNLVLNDPKFIDMSLNKTTNQQIYSISSPFSSIFSLLSLLYFLSFLFHIFSLFSSIFSLFSLLYFLSFLFHISSPFSSIFSLFSLLYFLSFPFHIFSLFSSIFPLLSLPYFHSFLFYISSPFSSIFSLFSLLYFLSFLFYIFPPFFSSIFLFLFFSKFSLHYSHLFF